MPRAAPPESASPIDGSRDAGMSRPSRYDDENSEEQRKQLAAKALGTRARKAALPDETNDFCASAAPMAQRSLAPLVQRRSVKRMIIQLFPGKFLDSVLDVCTHVFEGIENTQIGRG